MKRSDIYFQVIGKGTKGNYQIGYTSDPKAWVMNSNGWEPEQLIFLPKIKKVLDLVAIKKRCEEIRESIKNDNISYGEIAELQEFRKYIPKDDIELLQWAGIKEK